LTAGKTSAKPRTDGDSDTVIRADQPCTAPPPRQNPSSRSEAACHELRTMLPDGMQRRRTASARLPACIGATAQPGSRGKEQRRILLVGPLEEKTLDIAVSRYTPGRVGSARSPKETSAPPVALACFPFANLTKTEVAQIEAIYQEIVPQIASHNAQPTETSRGPECQRELTINQGLNISKKRGLLGA
jgi:hypothetical protein